MGGKLQQRFVVENADHDGVDVARQHARGIGDGLAAAELHLGAGDNVVRFLAPLIVTEAEIEQSVACLERACVALSSSQLKKAAG